MEVKAPGMQTVAVNVLTLPVGSTVRQDFSFKVAPTSEIVETTAAAPPGGKHVGGGREGLAAVHACVDPRDLGRRGCFATYTGIVRLACVVAMCGLVIFGVHAQPRKMIQVDDTFHGREVALQVGQTLKVSLSENASTGHQWSIPAELKSKLTPVLREREETVEAPDGPPGRPGVRNLYFEAVAAGTADLEIHYRRPWERNAPPARKFKLRVLVQRASDR
jgi:inhibitor of cysteine peptidase